MSPPIPYRLTEHSGWSSIPARLSPDALRLLGEVIGAYLEADAEATGSPHDQGAEDRFPRAAFVGHLLTLYLQSTPTEELGRRLHADLHAGVRR